MNDKEKVYRWLNNTAKERIETHRKLNPLNVPSCLDEVFTFVNLRNKALDELKLAETQSQQKKGKKTSAVVLKKYTGIVRDCNICILNHCNNYLEGDKNDK